MCCDRRNVPAVGLVQQTGPHIFQTCPSGNYYEYKAQTIGARSQSAKTYLEKHFTEFDSCELDALVKHALMALKETVQSGELNAKNCSVGIVGPDMRFRVCPMHRSVWCAVTPLPQSLKDL